MTKMNRPTVILSLVRLLTVALLLAAVTSCSTTKRLPEGETLYTGIKKIDIVAPSDEKLSADVKTTVTSAVDVAPNNYISMLGMRSPFPIGLWVYNNWNPDSKGLKRWAYNKLVEEPVVVSDVRPALRVKMIEDRLDNEGYFRNNASYELVYNKKNPRKAEILYTVKTGPAYIINSIDMLPDTSHLYHKIDSLAQQIPYLKAGNRYSVDSLSTSRIEITNSLRNLGYYFFRPEYIEYLADSTIKREKIALRLSIARNIPNFALQRFYTGDVTVLISRNQGGGTPDTLVTDRATIIKMSPSKLRPSLIPSCLTFRRGRTFSVRDMNSTQTFLSRLGVFNYINIDAIPDTTAARPTLNVAIECTFDAPYEASLEANVSSKSNSYLGPGLTMSVTNRNVFGGGEQLRTELTGTYEWQTGKNRSSVFNSYEVGVNASLAFPRLLAPHFVGLSRRDINWTRFTLNADLLNRPHYFNMAQFGASMNYDWQMRKYFSYTFTPLKITFIKMMRTTETFDSIIDANPAIGLSFRNQFIPQIGWSMTYDRDMNYYNHINVQTSVAEAGNIFWALWRAFGVTGEKRLFGMPFSQFLKGTAQVVYSRRVGEGDSWLVSRVFGGIAHAYGNSSEVPYSEQFYVGGANSIRAFGVRSIGPGSYHPGGNNANNFDETGTFKFEFNVEYRFPIAGILHGALFLDSGNVWLLKNDPQRPGGQLVASRFFKELAVGTGVGLRVDVSMLVLRGDLGIGIHAPYDTGKSGYYNMTSFKDSLAFHLAIGYPF